MQATQSERILELAKHNPLLRAADLRQQGLNPQLLLKLHGEGRLRRVARGLYAGPQAAFNEHQSLAEVCRRVPKAVVCLLSALQFHEIGTQLPHEVWIALPEGSQTPVLEHPALRVARMRAAAYSSGIQTVDEQGATLRVYSVAKTITDCFKFRNKIGLDVALEALKEAWGRRKVTMDDLWRYAQINRVANVMRPYLEAVVA